MLIGILTQPKSNRNGPTFPTEHYILGVNRDFIETSGMAKAVPIHFDLPEDELYTLLDKIDGVHLTGGGLDLYNFTTDQWHPYYITSRRIFNYAVNGGAPNSTDSKRKFLLTGICQGFEVLSILASNDKNDLLRVIEYENVNRLVYWRWNSTDQIRRESRMFAGFHPTLLKAMAEQEMAFHFHTYGISTADYNAI